MGAGEKTCIKISVRNLVECVLSSGDIDNRRTSGAEKDAMQAGSRIPVSYTHLDVYKRQRQCAGDDRE